MAAIKETRQIDGDTTSPTCHCGGSVWVMDEGFEVELVLVKGVWTDRQVVDDQPDPSATGKFWCLACRSECTATQQAAIVASWDLDLQIETFDCPPFAPGPELVSSVGCLACGSPRILAALPVFVSWEARSGHLLITNAEWAGDYELRCPDC